MRSIYVYAWDIKIMEVNIHAILVVTLQMSHNLTKTILFGSMVMYTAKWMMDLMLLLFNK